MFRLIASCAYWLSHLWPGRHDTLIDGGHRLWKEHQDAQEENLRRYGLR